MSYTLTTAQTTRYIRQRLAAAFPKAAFAVRAGRGTSAWVSVRWADGPSTGQVRAAANEIEVEVEKEVALDTSSGPVTGRPGFFSGINLHHDASEGVLAGAQLLWRQKWGPEMSPAGYRDTFTTSTGERVDAGFGNNQILAIAYGHLMPLIWEAFNQNAKEG